MGFKEITKLNINTVKKITHCLILKIVHCIIKNVRTKFYDKLQSGGSKILRVAH